MTYRIDFDEPLGDEVRRIAGAQFASAREVLTSQPKGLHKAVHDARKNIKRVRALHRLVALSDRGFARHQNARLRGVAAGLAELRDISALSETARYLEHLFSSGDKAAAVLVLSSALERQATRTAPDDATTVRRLQNAMNGLSEAEAALADIDLPESAGKVARCIAKGWRKTTEKAVDALDAANKAEPGTAYHDLRKRTQDRWMQSRLLQALWPAGMQSMRDAAKALADLLGHEHDLDVLCAHIAASEELRAERQILDLLPSIIELRRKLQDQGRTAARSLFDIKARRDANIIRALLD
jgi:CHAD domain-containing protein